MSRFRRHSCNVPRLLNTSHFYGLPGSRSLSGIPREVACLYGLHYRSRDTLHPARYFATFANAARTSSVVVMAYLDHIERVLCPVQFIETCSLTPLFRRSLATLRRMSCGIIPGQPALVVAVFHDF